MKKQILPLLFLLFAFRFSAQDAAPNATASYLTASPEVSGVKKQSSVPVNLSTGTPQIQVPLASLSGKTMAQGYGLAYDASGRRVDEVARYTGWGWNLVGGGQITRVVKGKQDEYDGCISHGYSAEGHAGYNELVSWVWNTNPVDEIYVHNIPAISNGHEEDENYPLDVDFFQPDEFYFSFNGRSGMFVLDENGNPQLIPYQNLTIEYQPCLHWFTITDEQGYIYKFEFATLTEFGMEPYPRNAKAATTWYLSTIRNPNRETEFTFIYESGPEVYEANQVNIRTAFYGNGDCPPTSDENNTYYNRSQTRRIRSVEAGITGARIEFKMIHDREDLDGDKSLDEIWIINESSDTLSKILLDYAYFKNENDGDERLKLTGIREKNGDNDTLRVNSFVYDETNPVFSDELLAGKDHWGYYNGLNFANIQDINISGGRRRVDPSENQIGILKEIVSATGGRIYFEYETNTYSESPSGIVENEPVSPMTVSATTEVNENHYFDIIDPVENPWVYSGPYTGPVFGGSPNTYQYPEPNCGLGYTFKKSGYTPVVNPEAGSDGVFVPDNDTDIDHPDYPSNLDDVDEEVVIVPEGRSRSTGTFFSIDEEQDVELTAEIAKSVCETHLSSVKIYRTFAPYGEVWSRDGSVHTTTLVDTLVHLTPGTYRLVCTAAFPYFEYVPSGYEPYLFDTYPRITSAEVVIQPMEIVQPGENTRYGGGLRIKSVLTDDGDDDHKDDIVTEYEYDFPDQPGVSSGYLLSDPVYSYYKPYYFDQWKRIGMGCAGDIVLCHECDHSLFISSGVNALVAANGAFIAYRNVREKACTDPGVCDDGWIDYAFSLQTNTNADPVFQAGQPYKSWRTGLPVSTGIYRNDGRLLSMTENNYSQILPSPNEIKGMRVGVTNIKSVAKNEPACEANDHYCEHTFSYDVLYYKYFSEMYAPVSTISRIYDQDDSLKFMETKVSYAYEAFMPGLPSRITTETSDPVFPFAVEQKKYVGDYTVTSGGDTMSDALNELIHEREFGFATEVESILLKGTSLSQLSVYEGRIQTLRIVGNRVLPDEAYVLQTDQPIADSVFAMSQVSSGVFIKDNHYRRTGKILSYDNKQRPLSIRDENDMPRAFIRDYKDGRVVAEITNAQHDQCAYTSFETTNTGGWNYYNPWTTSPAVTVYGFDLRRAKTGRYVYAYQGGSVTRTVGAGKYVLSLWSNTSAFSVTVDNQAQTAIVSADGIDPMNWMYYEFLLECDSTAVVAIFGSTGYYMDELRLYPADATMQTVSYNTDGTVRSQCDANNRVTTYLYDAWRRQEWSLDDYWKPLTHTEYHIKDADDPDDYNRVKTQVIVEDGMTRTAVLSASPGDEAIRTTILYKDGLGRPDQQIAVRQAATPQKDIITMHKYDALGREPIKFLGFASTPANNGERLDDPEGSLLGFYAGTARVVETAYPFAEVQYEPSPLNRVTEMGNYGETWQPGSGHTVAQAFLLNNANEVLLWKSGSGEVEAMAAGLPEYYPANTLLKQEVTDEHGIQSWEYTNAAGLVVCKRVKVMMSGSGAAAYTWHQGNGLIADDSTPVIPGTEPSWKYLSTYFVYDEFGRKIFEIPAIAVLACNGNYILQTTPGGTHYDIFDGYVSASKYDERGRETERKKPGEGWNQYIYNNLNQVILSKSPELDDRWNYVKYDVFGRAVQTGLYTSSDGRSVIQAARDSEITGLWETKTGNTSAPYTNNSFPTANTEVLTETYYDDYVFDLNGYSYTYLFTPPVQQGKRIRGMQTGGKKKVLDGGTDYLATVHYYDMFGRLSVDFEENILGGVDKLVTEYDFAGKPVETLRKFRRNSGTTDALTVTHEMEYDHASRPTFTRQRIGNGPEVVLSKLIYNEIGQLSKKHLHMDDSTNAGMQIIDYRYNERGWLTKINNADLVNDGDNLEYWDVFGEEIVYHEEDRFYSTVMQMDPQYNGNVAAIKWKTNRNPNDVDAGEMAGHSYVFRYDQLGEMTGAFYAASSDTYIDNYSYRTNMWDEKVSYDANGNIGSILRKRGSDSNGVLLTTALTVDQLAYTYYTHSNKIMTIQDAALDTWVSLSATKHYSHFIDDNTGGTEYTYDQEGRILTDANKGFTYAYNHLDLVHNVTDGTENVNFTWDATGKKWAKQTENDTIYYLNGMEYMGSVFTHMATWEGTARPSSGQMNDTLWIYDYYLKDHLGNVRAIITTKDSDLITEKVTVEKAVRVQEEESFLNVTSTEKDKPYLYPYDPEDPDSEMVTELSAMTGKVMGPAKVMAVEAGEKIDVSTAYWYTEEPGDPLSDFSEVLAGTLLNLGAAAGGVIPEGPDQGMALLNNVSSTEYDQFSSFLSDAFEETDFNSPQAYIVYMSFDKNMKLDASGSGMIRVQEAHALGRLTKNDIKVKKDGYFYVYVTNKSEGKVDFDNLTVRRWSPKVRVVYDYYPYGLMWENPWVPGTSNGIHDHAYQDKEFQFAEFSDDRGLAMYDFHARLYDPATGRWSVPDPAAQFSNPYLAMGNNPVVSIDPDGEWIQFAIGAVVGGVAGYQIGEAQGATGLRMAGYIIGGALIGAASGGLSYAIATSGMAAANTTAIMAGSFTSSVGFSMLSGGRTDVSISFGGASYNVSQKEWGYLGKKDNSTIENVGYGFGVLANVSDVLAGSKPSDVQLNTEKSDAIGHSALTKIGETDPHNSLVSVGPNPSGKWIFNPFKFKKGTNHWKNYVDAGDDVWKVNIKGINLQRITNYGANLNEGVNYNLYFSSCVNHTARALTLAGAPSIGIHPFILHSQMYLRSIGFRPMLYSYYLYQN